MNIIYNSDNGKLIHGDNIKVMDFIEINSIDSCISDFPYDLSFMGKKWDSTGNFYEWCKARAEKLFKILKPGGYALIFGHPKTNHRMKCAFEDIGFNIVEEIDWIYLTGMPKNQDIEKLFIKKDNQDMAKIWEGWKTSGLKPAHEPITVFQKPLEGAYIQNLEKYGCGAMNIDVCRVEMSQKDINMINAKASKNDNQNYSKKDDAIFGEYEKCYAKPANTDGRFPTNIIMDEYVANLFDEQTGMNDLGGGSRMFTIIKYQQKVSPKERLLPDGERNPHVTLKPKELIKWLIKLVTPLNGTTIDITAGSGTHAVACEELNKNEGYKLKWINIELLNTISEPHCNTAIKRLKVLK